MVGMWLNCIYGGKGVGMINMLLFVIVGIFVAGQMVGRTPEYLGKKIGRREVTLALIALLDPPDHDPLANGSVCGDGLGHEGDEQSRAARFFADYVSVLVVVGEQRLGLRRTGHLLWIQRQPDSGAGGHSLGYRLRAW